MEPQTAKRIVYPGDHLSPANERHKAGGGCYVQQNNIFAGVAGTLRVSKDEVEKVDAQGEKSRIIVSTFSVDSGNKAYRAPVLGIGSIVIGKITRLKEDMAFVRILSVDGQANVQNLEGVIRKQNVREFEIDKVQMDKSFIPGDIVKTRIVSLGDSQRIFLSTAGDDLGVLFVKHQETKKLMLPFSWEEMMCLASQLKEYRKVAKPNLSIFEAQQ